MTEINILNIPAYQRKRSILAKSNKTKRLKPTKATRPALHASGLDILVDIPFKETHLPTPSLYEQKIIKSTTRKTKEMKICGRCDGYFDNINVAIIEVTSPIKNGEKLIFETISGLFEEKIDSMQLNKRDINLARSGNIIGVKVSLEPKVGGNVYKYVQ